MFYTQTQGFCNTCVHFQWKKTNSSRHIGILSALRMRGLHDKRQLLAKLRIAGSENPLDPWSEEISFIEERISLDSNSSRGKIHYSTSEISSGSLDIYSKISDY